MFNTDEYNYIVLNDQGFLEIKNYKKPSQKIEFENLKLKEMPMDIRAAFENILISKQD